MVSEKAKVYRAWHDIMMKDHLQEKHDEADAMAMKLLMVGESRGTDNISDSLLTLRTVP